MGATPRPAVRLSPNATILGRVLAGEVGVVTAGGWGWTSLVSGCGADRVVGEGGDVGAVDGSHADRPMVSSVARYAAPRRQMAGKRSERVVMTTV